MKSFLFKQYTRFASIFSILLLLSISYLNYVPQVFATDDFTVTNVIFDPLTGHLEFDCTSALNFVGVPALSIVSTSNSPIYWERVPSGSPTGNCTSSHCWTTLNAVSPDTGVTSVKIANSGYYSQTLDYPLPIPTIYTPQNPSAAGGWQYAGETWTYASADDPTYTFTVSGDKTGMYSPGMKVKLTQSSVKYFIVTGVSYSSPNTTVTIYGGTDYDLSNSAITSPYFSSAKEPKGFPFNPSKWTEEITDNTALGTSNPTLNSWYNAKSIDIPVGVWNVSYQVGLYGYGSTGLIHALSTLSTGNNSESDPDFTSQGMLFSLGSGTVGSISPVNRKKVLSVSSKTSYYLNYKVATGNATDVGFGGNSSKTIIRAVSSYL